MFFWDDCQINLKTKVPKHFREETAFETHSGRKFPHIAMMKNSSFFSKKTHFFPKKTQILKILRVPTFPVALRGQFPTIYISQTLFEFGNVNEQRNWQTPVKNNVGNAFLIGRFSFLMSLKTRCKLKKFVESTFNPDNNMMLNINVLNTKINRFLQNKSGLNKQTYS